MNPVASLGLSAIFNTELNMNHLLIPLGRIGFSIMLIGLTPLGAKEPTETAEAATCSCGAADTSADDAESWAIRGVVESVLTERHALLVKHEEIPGFMRAMTMMFQVDLALLPKIKPGDSLTATMKRAQPRGWLLEDVKIINP